MPPSGLICLHTDGINVDKSYKTQVIDFMNEYDCLSSISLDIHKKM
jgi:hypothetical protein